MQQKFPNVFNSEIGCCTKTKISLRLKSEAKPVICPKQPIAYSILQLVDTELARLEQIEIILPVNYFDWAAPIIVVCKKNRKILIAKFLTGLNNSLEPNRHLLLHPDEIFVKLGNCEYFSQIDFSDAFLQVQVDENLKHHLTINTYRYVFISTINYHSDSQFPLANFKSILTL